MGIEREIGELLERKTTLKLTHDELKLLDWVLHQPSPMPSPVDLEWHMRWKELRESLWAGIHRIEIEKAKAEAIKTGSFKEKMALQPIELSPVDCSVLLALVPTTYRWGPGKDCGFSLKLKLFQFLSGEEEYHADETDDANKDPSSSTGGTPEGTVAGS